MTSDELLDMLAKFGGKVVTTAGLNTAQIATARIENRMYIRGDGCGFVHMPLSAKMQHVAEVASKYGDPEEFGERELLFDEDLVQKLPYGTKLYVLP